MKKSKKSKRVHYTEYEMPRATLYDLRETRRMLRIYFGPFGRKKGYGICKSNML